jgi:hypothetical protein
MALTKNDFTRALTWVRKTFDIGVAIVKTLNVAKATEYLVDVQTVIESYLKGAETIMPTNGVPPWPKNFFSQLSWISRNMGTIGAFLFAGNAKDPFKEGRALAAAFAVKYNFTY